MMSRDLIDRTEMRHQINLLLAGKPPMCEPFKEGQYAGLRTAARLLDAMPAAPSCGSPGCRS
jgi:hypothetical protein